MVDCSMQQLYTLVCDNEAAHGLSPPRATAESQDGKAWYNILCGLSWAWGVASQISLTCGQDQQLADDPGASLDVMDVEASNTNQPFERFATASDHCEDPVANGGTGAPVAAGDTDAAVAAGDTDAAVAAGGTGDKASYHLREFCLFSCLNLNINLARAKTWDRTGSPTPLEFDHFFKDGLVQWRPAWNTAFEQDSDLRSFCRLLSRSRVILLLLVHRLGFGLGCFWVGSSWIVLGRQELTLKGPKFQILPDNKLSCGRLNVRTGWKFLIYQPPAAD